MRRAVILLAIWSAAVAGCASSASIEPPERVLAVNGGGYVIRQSTADEKTFMELDAPADSVWKAVMLAYADLAIEPGVSDRANGVYGNPNFVAPKTMGGRSLNVYFHCGSGLTAPSAQEGRLTTSMVTVLTPSSQGRTRVATHVAAMLRRSDGASSNPVVCASTGALQQWLHEAIASRLKSP
jgi:hypothetical protein